MAEFYSLRNRLATDKDLKPINDKLNIESPISVGQLANTQNVDQIANGIVGSKIIIGRTADTSNSNILLDLFSNFIVFGVNGTKAILDVQAGDTSSKTRKARIIGANGKEMWSEDIAWKSDIQRLESEVADLKKQIGGVINPAINYVRKALSHFISLEVA